jgi:Ca-activated chloride channel family protein
MDIQRPPAAGLTAAAFGLMAAALVSVALPAGLRAQGHQDRQVYVSVVDANGEPVAGLTPTDFEVREDGAAREVLRVAPATGRMTIAVLIDDSQAATRAIPDIRKGLQSFVTALSKGNEISLITFGERPTILVDYTATLAQLTDGVNRLFARPGSGAYLLEAIVEASRGLKVRNAERPVIVAITTEGQEFSNDYYAQVLDALHQSHASLNALILTNHAAASDTTDEARNRQIVLARGTASTGGSRQFLLSETAITSQLDLLARQLTHEYRLVYARPDSLIPPTKLEVSVRRHGLTARATTLAGDR